MDGPCSRYSARVLHTDANSGMLPSTDPPNLRARVQEPPCPLPERHRLCMPGTLQELAPLPLACVQCPLSHTGAKCHLHVICTAAWHRHPATRSRAQLLPFQAYMTGHITPPYQPPPKHHALPCAQCLWLHRLPCQSAGLHTRLHAVAARDWLQTHAVSRRQSAPCAHQRSAAQRPQASAQPGCSLHATCCPQTRDGAGVRGHKQSCGLSTLMTTFCTLRGTFRNAACVWWENRACNVAHAVSSTQVRCATSAALDHVCQTGRAAGGSRVNLHVPLQPRPKVLEHGRAALRGSVRWA